MKNKDPGNEDDIELLNFQWVPPGKNVKINSAGASSSQN